MHRSGREHHNWRASAGATQHWPSPLAENMPNLAHVGNFVRSRRSIWLLYYIFIIWKSLLSAINRRVLWQAQVIETLTGSGLEQDPFGACYNIDPLGSGEALNHYVGEWHWSGYFVVHGILNIEPLGWGVVLNRLWFLSRLRAVQIVPFQAFTYK